MAQRVSAAFREAFPDGRLIVVSNRQPYVHQRGEAGDIVIESPAGGLSLALDPVLQAVGGLWVAWGHGDADRLVVDERDHLRVPPDEPAYSLRRLWLTDAEIEDYYLGFSNQGLWPLCHNILQHVRFRDRYWAEYRRVNLRFARAVADELGEDSGLVWFHDYHLALAPRRFRMLRREAVAAHFWHIPWPAWETFRVCPWKLAILEGLLGNDLLGFHLDSFANNFLDACERELGAFVDRKKQRVVHRGHVTHVADFPISIDVRQFESLAESAATRGIVAKIRDDLGLHGKRVGIGVDRLDYTKGIVERIEALRLLFQRYPELVEAFTFIQIAVPSRSEIPAYQTLEDELDGKIEALNQALATDSWKPVITIKDSLPQSELAAYYRLADMLVVSSIQDGMNLVVKEYVACQGEAQPGAVCLSEFAGASEELAHTLPVNPFYTQGFAEDLKRALDMPLEERRARMAAMKTELAGSTIFDWMARFLDAAGAAGADNLAHRPGAAARS
ncbi:MAG TPA: trehalose-6-phosphate synthase [Gemmatimonadota bacterium]|nr:trehalose-6-phosphate synthase [Gemmatimonadota bacterium]